MGKFSICHNKGFHLQFDNGLVLSTQFGGGNYCENYDNPIETYKKGQESPNAEIAIWNTKIQEEKEIFGKKRKDDKWITKEMAKDIFNKNIADDVLGYIEFSDWLRIVEWCKNYK